jgi:hypothetical protein
MFFMKHAEGNGEEPPPSGDVEERLAVVEGDMAMLKAALRLFLGV